jgi:CDP-archaeol synthase
MFESLKVLVVILPVVAAGIVHSAAIRFDWLPQLAKPLDFGMRLGGQPLLGANKTFRGPIIMIVVSAASAWALSFWLNAGWLPHGFGFMAQPERAAWLGAVMGLGYALGELPNSFVKRRLGIAPGGTPGGISGAICYMADQVDSVVGVVVLLGWVYAPPAGVLLALLAAGSIIHVVFDQCLYAAGVKRRVTGTETAPPPLARTSARQL